MTAPQKETPPQEWTVTVFLWIVALAIAMELLQYCMMMGGPYG